MFKKLFFIFAVMLIAQSCGITEMSNKYSSSVMDYLYPDQQVVVKPSIPTLRLPIKVGIAFVPEKSDYRRLSLISEAEKTMAVDSVRREFESYGFIDSIQIIPSTYLLPKGGFENLSWVGQTFDIDVVVLISYDQVQHTRENLGSLTYLTIVGGYIFKGDVNDTSTMVDATVYHIESRKLLFRAPGVSHVNDTSNYVKLNENMRKDSCKGFMLALQDMIPNLKMELENFKVRMKQKPDDYQIVHEPGYTGAGLVDFMVIALMMGALYSRRRD